MNINAGDKLYIIVRQDISPGLQCAQSVHVAFSFAYEHNEATKNWMSQSNYIAVLNCKNEESLYDLIDSAKKENIKFSIFREPDINNEITAIAIEPGQKSKELTGKLKLALRDI